MIQIDGPGDIMLIKIGQRISDSIYMRSHVEQKNSETESWIRLAAALSTKPIKKGRLFWW